MDYFISSALYELERAQEHYSERLVLVPNAGTLSYYHKPELPAPTLSRTDFGLSDKEHVYFCPQTLFKMHPKMDDVFAGIAQRDPDARIVLIEPAHRHMRDALEERLKHRLPEAAFSKIYFIKRLKHADYLRLMSCADVMLDTVHFNGQNTNLEAFSLRIPVVTWPGTMQRERHTVGMYKAMGEALFADLIASDAEDYAAKAVRIACEPMHRATLQARIEHHSDVLYANNDFIRAVEEILIRAVEDSDRKTD